MLNPDQLAVRALNVDSRTRIKGLAEDATIVLQDPLELPEGACCWVTGWNLPITWPNVSSLNDQLYLTERVPHSPLRPRAKDEGENPEEEAVRNSWL